MALLGPYYIGLYRPWNATGSPQHHDLYRGLELLTKNIVHALLLLQTNFSNTYSRVTLSGSWQTKTSACFMTLISMFQCLKSFATLHGTADSLLRSIVSVQTMDSLVKTMDDHFSTVLLILRNCSTQEPADREKTSAALQCFMVDIYNADISLLEAYRDISADAMTDIEMDVALVDLDSLVKEKIQKIVENWTASYETILGATRFHEVGKKLSRKPAMGHKLIAGKSMKYEIPSHQNSTESKSGPSQFDVLMQLAESVPHALGIFHATDDVPKPKGQWLLSVNSLFKHASFSRISDFLESTPKHTLTLASFEEEEKSAVDYEELLSISRQASASVVCKNRSWRLQTYRSCVTGADVVAFLHQHLHSNISLAMMTAVHVKEAVALGNRIVFAGLLHHVSSEHLLENRNMFYRFAPCCFS